MKILNSKYEDLVLSSLYATTLLLFQSKVLFLFLMEHYGYLRWPGTRVDTDNTDAISWLSSLQDVLIETDLTYIKCSNIYTLEFKFKWVFQNGILKANTRFHCLFFFIKQVWPTMVLWSVEEQQ